MRNDCKEMRADFHKMKEDYGNPKDGIIQKIYCKIDDGLRRLHVRIDDVQKDKIGRWFFIPIIGVLIAISSYGLIKAYAVDGEHKDKFATKQSMETHVEKLEKAIDQTNEKVDTIISQQHTKELADQSRFNDLMRAIESK